ncbi:MAG: hypothetical protein ACREC0_10580 [Methylocella sp.]
MREWGYWDWLAYVVLFIAALELAISQTTKLKGLFPSFIFNGIWLFLRLVMMLFSTCILVAREFGWIGRGRITTVTDAIHEAKPIIPSIPPPVIQDKSIHLQLLEIDLNGNYYVTFDRVGISLRVRSPASGRGDYHRTSDA